MLHYLLTLTQPKYEEGVINTIGEEMLNDLIELGVLVQKDSMVLLSGDHRMKAYQATSFRIFMNMVEKSQGQ